MNPVFNAFGFIVCDLFINNTSSLYSKSERRSALLSGCCSIVSLVLWAQGVELVWKEKDVLARTGWSHKAKEINWKGQQLMEDQHQIGSN